MKYMLLLFGDERAWERLGEEDLQAEMARYERYDRELTEAGVFVAGEGLQPTPTATTMRIVGGERVLTDGPFAGIDEAAQPAEPAAPPRLKEQLGGFYVIDCKDLDDALAWAERCPASAGGSIEIRPVIEYAEVARSA